MLPLVLHFTSLHLLDFFFFIFLSFTLRYVTLPDLILQKPPLENGETLHDYSQPLREAGIITMAVGVAAANDAELEAIAGDSRRVFWADNINKLSKAVDSIASKICKCKY